jgi:carboxyl-terminal processing protease
MSDETDLKNTINIVAAENKRSSSKFIFVVLFLGVFVCGFIGGFFLKQERTIIVPQSRTSDSSRYRLYDEIWNEVEKGYITKDIDEEELIYGGAKGIVKSLGDKFSVFLTPEEVHESNKSNAGVFEGIGTTLRFDGDYTVIETPIMGFPAWEAGLMPMDIILEVDEQDMAGKAAYFVADRILGKAGTVVRIKVFRESEGQTFEFEITRAKIDIDNVEVEELENGIYRISIRKFTDSSIREFERLWNLSTSQIENPKGIILDLRNNPGGFVDSAKYVLEDFTPSKIKLLSEEDRNKKIVDTFSSKQGRFVGIPVVVLINNGSASASEIVAGALRDHKLATLVGEQTLGKGVEQKVVSLSDGSRIHLVFKNWLTPNGHHISFENPIVPDEIVNYTMENFKAQTDPQLERAIEILGE